MRVLRERADRAQQWRSFTGGDPARERAIPRRWRTSARSRPRAGGRTSRSWSRSAREYGASVGGRVAGRFCSRSRCFPTADSLRDEEGLVTLMTLHNAKGSSSPIVFIIGCEEASSRHSARAWTRVPEEERRLCYVRHHCGPTGPLPRTRAPATCSGSRMYGLRQAASSTRSRQPDRRPSPSRASARSGRRSWRAAQTTWDGAQGEAVGPPEFRLGDDRHAASARAS